MEKIKLIAVKRSLKGRKVKKLRREGLIPANVFGKKIKSLAVEVKEKDFAAVYKKAGETSIVNLAIEDETRPVLIKHVQVHPVTESLLHIDFHQVDLKEKVTATIPLEFTGESKAVKDKTGVLLQILSEIEVEALPTELPEKIQVDTTGLSQIDQVIKVSDIKLSEKVRIMTSSQLDIIKVAPLVSKEAEKMVKEEQAAAAAAAQAETAETAKTEEGQQAPVPSAGAKQETKTAESKTAPQDK